MRLQRIVVGVDGSMNSLAAVEWAAGMATICGAEVVAVHALGLLEHLEGPEGATGQTQRQQIQDRFEATWCAPLNQAGIPSRRQLRDGSPVEVLLRAAEDEARRPRRGGEPRTRRLPRTPARQHEHPGRPELPTSRDHSAGPTSRRTCTAMIRAEEAWLWTP